MSAQPPTQSGEQFRDEMDAYQFILRQTQDDDILNETNFGLGNYGDSEYWQQIRGYRKGKFVELAFARIIEERAIHETKVKLAREGISFYDESGNEVKQFDAWNDLKEREKKKHLPDWIQEETEDTDGLVETRDAILSYGDYVWEMIGKADEGFSARQKAALKKKTNYTGSFRPVFYRMLQVRHEASRSRGARLIDNALAGVNVFRGDGDVEDLLGGD